MATWTEEDLASLDRAHQIRVAGRRNDGSLRKLVTIWHVVVDGALYARSVKGTEGQWYKGDIRHGRPPEGRFPPIARHHAGISGFLSARMSISSMGDRRLAKQGL